MATFEQALKAMRIAKENGDMETARRMARLASNLRQQEMSAQASEQKPDMMGQLNKGLAQGLGAPVDVVNWGLGKVGVPVSDEPFLGSKSLEGMMQSVGAEPAQEAPEGFAEGFARGGGQALGAAPLAAGGMAAAGARLPGAYGLAATDASRALSTTAGVGMEGVAGGLSGGAMEAAEEAGGGPIAQGLAGLAAPLSIPAAGGVVRGAIGVAEKTPVAGTAIRMGRDVKRSMLPMTEGGAREVVREELMDAVGGPQRAEAMARRIDPRDAAGRTGPEQTGDPNLLGMQQAAAREYPEMGARREAQTSRAEQDLARQARAVGGDPAEARKFFDARRKTFAQNMQERVDNALGSARASLEGTGAQRTETSNSARMVQGIKSALDDTREEDRQMWAAVPLETDISGGEAARVARQFIEDTPRAQQEDIPATIREALDEGNELAGPTLAKELHGLYSKLRQIARNARAGTNTNENMARIADQMAEAVLDDLETLAPQTELGSSLRNAISHTRAMHETFDQGATGRILRRTAATDEQIAPEVALKRTIGRGGSDAFADDINLRAAAGSSAREINDYLRGKFSEAVFDASGDVRLKSARTWMRNNRELLSRYPELRKELMGAISTQEKAEAFAARAQERIKLADQGPLKDFSSGQIQKAATAIIGADNPVQAARSIMAAAKKDPSGKAVDGVKGAFADYLIRDPNKFPALLADKDVSSAMRQVFSPEEVRRLRRIAVAQKRMSRAPNQRGQLLNTPANMLIDTVVRWAAAGAASRRMSGSGMGGSLQAANIASTKAQKALRNLTNAKAREILRDAVLKDPELLKELLTTTPAKIDPQKSRLAPYLAGAASAQMESE